MSLPIAYVKVQYPCWCLSQTCGYIQKRHAWLVIFNMYYGSTWCYCDHHTFCEFKYQYKGLITDFCLRYIKSFQQWWNTTCNNGSNCIFGTIVVQIFQNNHNFCSFSILYLFRHFIFIYDPSSITKFSLLLLIKHHKTNIALAWKGHYTNICALQGKLTNQQRFQDEIVDLKQWSLFPWIST